MVLFSVYYSDNNYPLIYNGALLDKPIVTLENYCKWYNLYQIMPNGSISKFDSYVYANKFKYQGTIWSDHIPHPNFLKLLEQDDNYYLDLKAFEMAVGRYQLEVIE